MSRQEEEVRIPQSLIVHNFNSSDILYSYPLQLPYECRVVEDVLFCLFVRKGGGCNG